MHGEIGYSRGMFDYSTADLCCYRRLTSLASARLADRPVRARTGALPGNYAEVGKNARGGETVADAFERSFDENLAVELDTRRRMINRGFLRSVSSFVRDDVTAGSRRGEI